MSEPTGESFEGQLAPVDSDYFVASSQPEPPPPPPPPPLEPVAKTQRIAEMDIIRGLAILGVFLINMPLFNAPSQAFFNNKVTGWWPEWNHQAALWFIHTFAQGKFYTLFSFLFGMGFGVQMVRAMEKGQRDITKVYLRRLTVLLVIGIIHFTCLWWGDVLHVYATLGFLLFLLRKAPQKRLLRIAFALALFPMVSTFGYFIFQNVKDKYFTSEAQRKENEKKDAENLAKRPERRQKIKEDMHRNKVIMSTGTIKEVFLERFKEDRRQLPGEVGWGVELFTNFLFGLWMARSGLLERVTENLGFFRRAFWIGLIGGLGLSLLTHWLSGQLPDNAPNWQQALIGTVQEFISRPLSAVFYGAGLILLAQREFWLRVLAPMAAVGRMALTNYLTHTLISTTIFYSYGFGLYGKVGPAWGLLLCFVIYGLQLPFSVWWLNHYRFGPMEWVWRSLTYGRKQPMALAITA